MKTKYIIIIPIIVVAAAFGSLQIWATIDCLAENTQPGFFRCIDVNVDGPGYTQSAPESETFSCASVGISRYSSYDLGRIENARGPLKFLEFTDADLDKIPLIKKLIEDIGDRIEYHTHSYTTIPTEDHEYIMQYLYTKFEEQYGKPFDSEYNAYVSYNGSTYSVNTSLQVSEYFPTKTLIMEIGEDKRNQPITITGEDFASIPHIKTGIESIGKFEDSVHESVGVAEFTQREYIDYFKQKSIEQFGDTNTFNFLYNGKYYEPRFVIC